MSESTLRIDRWLWYTRFFKTRTLAADAVAGGHVRVNGERSRPGHRLRPGDRLEIVRNRERFVVTVDQLPARRGPATEAGACYTEDPEAREEREARQRQLREDRRLMPRTDGRPDKRTRRLLRQRQRSGD